MTGMPLIACAVVFALGAAAGHQWGRAPLLVQLAQRDAASAQAQFRAAERQAAVLQLAQARGDALTHSLVRSQAQITTLQKDRYAALPAFTSGRACLSGDAVRLLNDEPAADSGPAVPPAPGSAAAAGGAAATDGDVGHWVATARAEHAVCRQRLDALIDWHSPGAAQP